MRGNAVCPGFVVRSSLVLVLSEWHGWVKFQTLLAEHGRYIDLFLLYTRNSNKNSKKYYSTYSAPCSHSVLTHWIAQQHFDVGVVMVPFMKGGDWDTRRRIGPCHTASKWQSPDSKQHLMQSECPQPLPLILPAQRPPHIQTRMEHICPSPVLLFGEEKVHGARRNISDSEHKVELCYYLFAWLWKASIEPLQTSALSFIKWR